LRTHKNPDRICKKTGGYYLISGNSKAEKRVFFYDKSMGYELFSADYLSAARQNRPLIEVPLS
ncbi:MAG: hypothetical protein ACK443_05345, partial [Methylococcaceae bacterium]